jgi:hypothetical protein
MPHIARSRKRVHGWGGIALATAVAVAAVSAPAQAKPKPAAKAKPSGKRIAVLPPTDGTAKDAVVTAKIVKALKQHKIVAISGAPAKKAIATLGVPSSDSDWIALARKLKVDGVVESTISQTGGKREIDVAVHTGADGSVTGRETFAAKGPPPKLANVVAGGFWKKLGTAIKDTAPPKKDEAGPTLPATSPSETAPVAEKTEEAETPAKEAEPVPLPEPVEEKQVKAPPPKRPPVAKETDEEGDEEEADVPRKGKSWRTPRTVEVELGGRALQHLFEYTPASAGKALVEHFLPVFQGRAAWFPITYAGIFVSGEMNPYLATGTTPNYPAGTRELIAGAQGRLPLSFGVLGLSAGYFQHLFVIGDPSNSGDPARSQLVWPDVAYQGARVAASGRFYLGDMFKVGVEAAYRYVTNPGQNGVNVRSSTYFPNAKVNVGIDGSAFVSAGVLSWLEIRVGADYRRYVFGALAPGSNNANNTNASGAVDQYLGFSLGAVGVWGGK